MNLWLVVPVKPFDQGKSRLAEALPPQARAALMRELLTGVLARVRESGLPASVLVISRDEAVRAFAAELGVEALAEQGPGTQGAVEQDDDLNAALRQARRLVMRRGGDALLVLPADLPLLTVADLHQLYDLGLAGAEVVVAASHDGGTNALWLHPPASIDFAFGPHSFQRHVAQAAAAGRRWAVYRSETLDYDVDVPADLDLLAHPFVHPPMQHGR